MIGHRPSDYNEQIADEICERLINGESLRAICRDDGMPHVSTVCRWLVRHEEFREQYERARLDQADTLADEIIDIADDKQEDVQRSRLRVDARKWVASKLKPKKYGERQTIAGDPDAPLHTQVSLDVTKLSSEAMREILAARKGQE